MTQSAQEPKKIVISEHKKRAADHNRIRMVVIKTPIRKNQKGKLIYSSQTRHEAF